MSHAPWTLDTNFFSSEDTTKSNRTFDETLHMNIRPQWKQKYNLLKDYVEANPEIHIDVSEISIPEHLRDEFYKHFDDVRNAVVLRRYDSLPFGVDAF